MVVEWIKENAALLTLGVVLLGGVGGVAVNYHRINQLEVEQKHIQTEVRKHHEDIHRHVDPVRDKTEMADLKERLRRIEEKLDRIEVRNRRISRELEDR